jgi:hypothetical protein
LAHFDIYIWPTVARWIMRRRHWPQSYLPEFMADLTADSQSTSPKNHK